MYLHRIFLNLRCREVRRDISDPYELHSTLCRAFCHPGEKCNSGEFLWRLEPETSSCDSPKILLQSKKLPDWSSVNISGWLNRADIPIDLEKQLKLVSLKSGHKFRFRLRANPCVTRNGKRAGLLSLAEQENWIAKKGERHGFCLSSTDGAVSSPGLTLCVKVSQEQMLYGKQRSGNTIRIFSVLYDGILTVVDAERFVDTLRVGIGHGKAMGLGLLSVAPLS